VHTVAAPMSCRNGRLGRKRVLFPLLLMVFAFVSSAGAQAAPPNIIVIVADDLGYGDVGFNRCPDYATPYIDSIANNGALCTDGYVTCPGCSPSRAALLTGRYQQRFGHEEPPQSDNTNPRLGLPETETTLPQILKPAGYACGAIGKWHLGYTSNLQPLQRGFDEFFGFLGAESTYYDARLLQGSTHVIETAYLTDAFTREGVSFINRHATTPFFLYLAYNAVHEPYNTPPQTYLDRVPNITDPDRKKYAAMVIALDDGVGQVLQALQANNILNNTLIFFLSDNGAPQTTFTRNNPLRGYKLNVLEGGIRVPFAVQWPARLTSHVVYDQPVSALDIVATAAAAAGVSLPADRVYDGLDIVPFLAGEQISPDRTLFWRSSDLGSDGPAGCSDTIWAVRSGGLKIVTERDTTGQPPALYNLRNDIGEAQDLALSQPADVDSLNQFYSQWNAQTISPRWRREVAFKLHPLVLAGDWNAFNESDSTLPWRLTRVTAPAVPGTGTPDAFNWFINTVHVATAGGDTTPGVHSFAFVGGTSYSNQWGGVTINIDGTTSVPFFSGTALGPTNSISLEDGFYYSFRILEWGQQIGASMNVAVMKTSAPPISVSVSGQIPQTPTADDEVVVSITTSQAKSAEERIYLRWSTDFFITSHLVLAYGSGTNYSATISAQPAGTAVQYCILTSTVDLSPFVTSGLIDSLTLAASDNSKFIVSGTAPSITTQPANKTVNVGQTARFSVTATGTPPLQYQWRKNGADVPGATNSSYTTPATVAADNGSLFSVVVSNSGGSVTSNNATLTVRIPPTITTQPGDQAVTAGDRARFSVVATGTRPLRYQWTKNGVNITGATHASYTTPPTTPGDNGALFAVTVTNRIGSVTSNNATLTVY
jgi:arylsulfatase A-like enzyme